MRLLRDARAKAVAERLRPFLERKDYDAAFVDKILAITAHFIFLDQLSQVSNEPGPSRPLRKRWPCSKGLTRVPITSKP